MKIYRITDNGQAQCADIPDGTVVMEVGARLDQDGGHSDPITAIDRVRRIYWRSPPPYVTETALPWPERTISGAEIEALLWADHDPGDEASR